MTSRIFEWDEAKNLANQRKHDGVSFEEASQVFSDPLHVFLYPDRIESAEQRWQNARNNEGLCVLLVVAHTLTDIDENGEEIEIVWHHLGPTDRSVGKEAI